MDSRSAVTIFNCYMYLRKDFDKCIKFYLKNLEYQYAKGHVREGTTLGAL